MFTDRMSSHDLIQYHYRFLNPKGSLISNRQPARWKTLSPHPWETIRRQLVQSSVVNEADVFWIDTTHHRSINVQFLQRELALYEVFNCLAACQFDGQVNFTIRPFDWVQTHGKKERPRLGRGENWEEWLCEKQSSLQRFFVASLYYLLVDPSIMRVDEQTDALICDLQSWNASATFRDESSQQDLFLTFLPNHTHIPRQWDAVVL